MGIDELQDDNAKIDKWGSFRTITMSLEIYPLFAIMQTAYWFTDKYYLYIDYIDENHVTVYLRQKGKNEISSDVLKEFCNSVLDQAVRLQIRTETEAVHSIIVKRAFSEVLSPSELSLQKRLERQNGRTRSSNR